MTVRVCCASDRHNSKFVSSLTGMMRPLEFLVPRGVLLTGPPGVGKTFAVRSAVEAVRNVSSRARGGECGGSFEV